jgi:uncharacterized protein YqeY
MLEDTIYHDYVTALKSRDKPKADFLSLIRAEIKNAALELKITKLSDEQTMQVLKKQLKRLQDARQTIAASGRHEHVQSLEGEISLLAAYLPQPVSDEALLAIVTSVIQTSGATSIKDMGKVMKEVLAQVGLQADAKTVSDLVKRKLTPQ